MLTVNYNNVNQSKPYVYKTWRNKIDVVGALHQLAHVSALQSKGSDYKPHTYYGFLAEYALKYDLRTRGIAIQGAPKYQTGADMGDFIYDGKLYDVKASMKYDNISITPRADIDVDYYIGVKLKIPNARTIIIDVYGEITYNELGRADLGYCGFSMLIAPGSFKPVPKFVN